MFSATLLLRLGRDAAGGEGTGHAVLGTGGKSRDVGGTRLFPHGAGGLAGGTQLHLFGAAGPVEQLARARQVGMDQLGERGVVDRSGFGQERRERERPVSGFFRVVLVPGGRGYEAGAPTLQGVGAFARQEDQTRERLPAGRGGSVLSVTCPELGVTSGTHRRSWS